MATTTPNYGWPVPTSTDYVKDGATAIEALGDAIDATVFGLPAPGLVLVKTQTIGAAVSSIVVTDAFSATYDNYRIVANGGVGSTTQNFYMTLGSTTSGYQLAANRISYNDGSTNVFDFGNTAANFQSIGTFTTNYMDLNVEIRNPFKSTYTTVSADFSGTSGAVKYGGTQLSTTSFTGFTLTCNSGNVTGGTIRVYGYKNS